MSSNAPASSFVRLGTHNMVLPPEGPKVYPFVLDFRTQGSNTIDMIAEIQRGFISFVQGLFIDNSLNGQQLTAVADQTNHSIIVPPNSQMFMPMFISDSARITFTTTPAGNLTVPIEVTNVPVMPYTWKVT